MIDIRSDTVTQPTEAMRKAMAYAELGDDVYEEDPTVNRLEELGAQMISKEAALFVPSGCFGNQLALFTWCKRGTEIIAGEDCHIVAFEAGSLSIIAGVQLRCIPDPGGILEPCEIRKRLRKQDLHSPETSLVCTENAHSSGKVIPLEKMDAVREVTQQWGVPLHLDGARIFNAAAALGCKASEIADRADSVMFCLSKGLCAPVGSLLAGPKEFVNAARLKRKIMGGGMRQAGVLAAAGIIALEEHSALLAADHTQAKKIACELANINGIVINPDDVDINMVFFSHPLASSDEWAERVVKKFKEKNIFINMPEQGMFRFVTHYWIGNKESDAIISAARDIFKE